MDSNQVPTALSAWAERGLSELTLPSGTVIKVHIADSATLIRLGIIPADLIAIALRQGGSGTPTKEELVEYSRLGRQVAAGSVRAIRNDAGDWEPVTLTVEQADELALPIADMDLLEAVSMRRITVAQANAAVTGQPAPAAEADGTVNAFADFRGQREGAVAGDGGADVRPEPGEDVPGPDRSSSGHARRRSRGRAPA